VILLQPVLKMAFRKDAGVDRNPKLCPKRFLGRLLARNGDRLNRRSGFKRMFFLG
jgi:hypothetical protein